MGRCFIFKRFSFFFIFFCSCLSNRKKFDRLSACLASSSILFNVCPIYQCLFSFFLSLFLFLFFFISFNLSLFVYSHLFYCPQEQNIFFPYNDSLPLSFADFLLFQRTFSPFLSYSIYLCIFRFSVALSLSVFIYLQAAHLSIFLLFWVLFRLIFFLSAPLSFCLPLCL